MNNRLRKFTNPFIFKSMRRKPKIIYPFSSKSSIVNQLCQRRNGVYMFPAEENLNGTEQLPIKYCKYNVMENNDDISCLALSSNGTNKVVSGALDGRIMVFDLQPYSQSNIFFKSHHRDGIVSIKFLPASDDLQIISSDEFGLIIHSSLDPRGKKIPEAHLYNLHYGKESFVTTLVNSPSSFLSAGLDSFVNEIDLRHSHKTTSSFSTTNSYDRKIPVFSIASHPSLAEEFCTGGMDGRVRFYDRRFIGLNAKPVKTCQTTRALVGNASDRRITHLSYNISGTEVIANSLFQEKIFFFLISGTKSDVTRPLHQYQGPLTKPTVNELEDIVDPNINLGCYRTPFNSGVGAKFYGKEENFIVSGSARGELVFWDKNTEEIVRIFHGDQEAQSIVALETSEMLPMVITAGYSRSLKIWAAEI